MPAKVKVFRCQTFENNGRKLMAYITNLDDVPFGVATVDTITALTWQYETENDALAIIDGEQIGDEIEIDVESTIHDDIQTGRGWPTNLQPGFNLEVYIPAARFPEGGTWVRVELTITPSQTLGEEPFTVSWIVEVLPIASH
jgi:hypothetical protein